MRSEAVGENPSPLRQSQYRNPRQRLKTGAMFFCRCFAGHSNSVQSHLGSVKPFSTLLSAGRFYADLDWACNHWTRGGTSVAIQTGSRLFSCMLQLNDVAMNDFSRFNEGKKKTVRPGVKASELYARIAVMMIKITAAWITLFPFQPLVKGQALILIH